MLMVVKSNDACVCFQLLYNRIRDQVDLEELRETMSDRKVSSLMNVVIQLRKVHPLNP